MKFINMNKIKKALVMASAVFVVFSCEDPDKAPIVTFDSAGHGAYPRLVEEIGERNVDLFNLSGSQYQYSVEFVDEKKGELVAEYFLTLSYSDANDASKSVSDIQLRSWSASEFAPSADGYKGVANIVIKATDLIAAVGRTEADIESSDQFNVKGTVVMKNGAVFTGANSSASVEGSAFRGHFDFQLPAVCPSDLAGTHAYSTIPWCDGSVTETGTVTWTAVSSGVYELSDFAMGAYFPCYGATATLPGGSLKVQDICNRIFPVGTSRWGETYFFNSVSVSGADLTIDWENDYGEAGVTTLTREGGANWPALVN
jgi:hypothetical protein